MISIMSYYDNFSKGYCTGYIIDASLFSEKERPEIHRFNRIYGSVSVPTNSYQNYGNYSNNSTSNVTYSSPFRGVIGQKYMSHSYFGNDDSTNKSVFDN